MRTAETVLGVIRERGRRRLPLENLYRQLYNRDLFLHAYGRLYRNDGALTPGAAMETVDGMSLQKIEAIIDALRHEQYRWTPVRRTYIPKKSGKLRPLGLPTWSDKLLQEGIRLILEAYYEPQFNRDVVINKNSRARPGQSTADPVVSPLPHIDTMGIRRCYDIRAYLSAWFYWSIGCPGHLSPPSGLGAGLQHIPIG
jgi:hypothetical protein